MRTVVGHLRNPYIPEYDRTTGDRNVFGICSDGAIIRLNYKTTFRIIDTIPTSHIRLWYENKQKNCGWIPARIEPDGKVVDLVDYA